MTHQGIPRPSSVQVPPETITDEVSGIQVANRDREYYDQGYTQGWNDCAVRANETLAEAMGKVKKMLQDVLADVKAEPPNQKPEQTYFWWCPVCKEEKVWQKVTFYNHCVDCGAYVEEKPVYPPNQTIVQAGAELVDNAMKGLLNHGCRDVYSDYLTIGDIEKWLSSGKGAAYLAALVEAIRTTR